MKMLKVGPEGSRIEQGIDALGRDFKRTSNDFGLRHLLYENASCSICHGLGAKWAFRYVVRDYASKTKKGKICNTLQAHEREFWICPSCIENMEQLTGIRIQLPTEKPGKAKT
jgi:hypothetical protein